MSESNGFIDRHRYGMMFLLLPLFIVIACYEHGKEWWGDVWPLVRDTFRGDT